MLAIPHPSAIRPGRSDHNPKQHQRKKLDGRSLQEYIEEKKRRENSVSPLRGKLLLTWLEEADDEPQMSGDAEVDELDDWHRSALDLERERSISRVERWRTIVNDRQQAREERNTLDEWEIETYYSATRPSSVAPSEQSRRYSPLPGCSASGESHNLNPNGFSLQDHHVLQSRGRARTPRHLEDLLYQSQSSSSHRPSEKHGSGEKPTPAMDDRPIAYGNGPIRRPGHARPQEKPEESQENNKELPERLEEKPEVGSELEYGTKDAFAAPQADIGERQQRRRVRVFLPGPMNLMGRATRI